MLHRDIIWWDHICYDYNILHNFVTCYYNNSVFSNGVHTANTYIAYLSSNQCWIMVVDFVLKISEAIQKRSENATASAPDPSGRHLRSDTLNSIVYITDHVLLTASNAFPLVKLDHVMLVLMDFPLCIGCETLICWMLYQNALKYDSVFKKFFIHFLAFCDSDGVRHYDGELWNASNCQVCSCSQGFIRCFRLQCSLVHCNWVSNTECHATIYLSDIKYRMP